MRRRLLGAMLAIAVIAVIGFGAPLAIAIRTQYRDEALLTVSEEAARAVVAVPADFARTGDQPELPPSGSDAEVALYTLSGLRLVGTGPPIADGAVRAVLSGTTGRAYRSQLVVVLPVLDQERVVGAVRASLPESAVSARTHRAWALMGGLAAVVILVAGGFAADRSRRMARPLDVLRRDAEVIGEGGEVPSRPRTRVLEIDAVHDALARAAIRLNDAMARERSFGADVAHQLRTPLSSLRLQLEAGQLRGSSDDAMLETALDDVDRLQQTIDDLVALNRDELGQRDLHPLSTVIADAVERWAGTAQQAGREVVRVEGESLPWSRASQSAMRQIMDVLIGNALAHGAGTVRVSGRRVGKGAVLAVSDEGTRVVDAQAIFERRSGDATGTGIGLALARRLAGAEGMDLFVAYPGPGVSFHLVVAGAS